MGVHGVVRKSGANVQSNEAVTHLPLNVNKAMPGFPGERGPTRHTAE